MLEGTLKEIIVVSTMGSERDNSAIFSRLAQRYPKQSWKRHRDRTRADRERGEEMSD